MKSTKRILITGGTGSFGQRFVRTILQRYPEIERVVIYSRDELKQFEMAQELSPDEYPQVRYFIGDVRDKSRLLYALEGIDTVVHAAALKQVPAAEYNPFEAIKTNILGAQNVIEASIEKGVHRVVALSTDKAAAPINLYGATKLCSDKLFTAANIFSGSHDIRFSVVRYGNVMGSRGSVIPFFLKHKEKGFLPITSPEMSRFNITLNEGVELVIFAMENMWGSEIYVPKIPSYRILDVAEAIAPGLETRVVGIRPGEKLHEEMITEIDALNTIDAGKYFIILPSFEPKWDVRELLNSVGGTMCKPGFRYNSGENEEWLTVEELRELILTEVKKAGERI